jgi:hypothetical protein
MSRSRSTGGSSTRIKRLTGAVLALALGSLGATVLGAAPASATTTITGAPGSAIRVVQEAESQNGVHGDANQCNPYGSLCDDWCAMFADWTWSQGGINPRPTSYVARGVGAWAVTNHLWLPIGQGTPQPGDLAVYGPPDGQVGGHISVVDSVNPDGTLVTVDGNDGNQVVIRTINPATATAGADGVHISGYVTLPFKAGAGDQVNSGIDDINGDGSADLVVQTGNNVGWLANHMYSGGDPNSPYRPGSVDYSLIHGMPANSLVAVGDISGDGHGDAFIYSPGSPDYVKYYPNSAGQDQGIPYDFGIPVASGLSGVDGSAIVKIMAADVTGDGNADLEFLTAKGNLYYLPNNMDRNADHLPFYGQHAQLLVTGLPADRTVSLGDVNGDHKADVVYVDGGALKSLTNVGTGGAASFSGAGQTLMTSGFATVKQVVAADLSGDGWADLLYADTSGGVFYLPNKAGSNPGNAPFAGSGTNVASMSATDLLN